MPSTEAPCKPALEVDAYVVEWALKVPGINTLFHDDGFMWCVEQFGAICTILKKWKTPVEEC